jgi:hypothetical protein
MELNISIILIQKAYHKELYDNFCTPKNDLIQIQTP